VLGLGDGVEAISEPVRIRPSAFEDLYRDERSGMIRLAYLITQSRPVAEEIVHEAFLAVLERWTTLRSPGGYLRTAVVRSAVKSRTRRLREHDVALRQVGRDLQPPGVDEMWDALAGLPVNQRAALVLRFYEDLSHEQIAAVLHCNVATARSLTHRGLTALRKDIDRWTTA